VSGRPLTVVVDIEGTTSSTGFVEATLYPYSSARFPDELREHAEDPEVIEAARQVRELAGEPDAGVDRIVEILRGWIAEDRKATPLKTLQGRLWARGFAAGELTSHFYPDAIPQLRRWYAAGHRLVVFSSGSLQAQRTWFANSPDGDLLPLFDAHFDTVNGGPKRVASSYVHIANELEEEPGHLVFLSDLVDELDAARDARWHTVGVRREGEPHFDRGVGSHLEVASFDELDLSGPVPSRR
jgi:enolase-phosphatase E1